MAQIKLSPCFCLPGKRKTLSLVLVGNQNVIMKSDWRQASFLLQNKYIPRFWHPFIQFCNQLEIQLQRICTWYKKPQFKKDTPFTNLFWIYYLKYFELRKTLGVTWIKYCHVLLRKYFSKKRLAIFSSQYCAQFDPPHFKWRWNESNRTFFILPITMYII